MKNILAVGLFILGMFALSFAFTQKEPSSTSVKAQKKIMLDIDNSATDKLFNK